jgi:hypothetical protein
MSTTVTYKGETLTTVENQTRTLLTSGKYLEDDLTLVDISRGEPSLQAKTDIEPTTSSQTITPDSGYDGLSSVHINAMPTGTAGTPTATKGAVSNHSVSVTPSVTNTTGYITGGTKNGTAVTVSASELVSGSETKTANGTYDVTNLAELVVNVSGGGGASNYVHGSFTTKSASGAQSVTIPYTGRGYPIMATVVVKGGAYNSDTEYYNAIQRYAVGQWTLTKANMDTAPTYATSGEANYGVTTAIYKNSTSSATSYARTSSMQTNTYSTSNATAGAATNVRFRSSTLMSVFVAGTSYGLFPDTEYEYFIVYSS